MSSIPLQPWGGSSSWPIPRALACASMGELSTEGSWGLGEEEMRRKAWHFCTQ